MDLEEADLLPVALLEAGVTDGREDRQVLFELVHLPAEGLCHATGARQRGELLGQLVHGPPHEVQLLTDLLCIQFLERAWDQTERTWISKLNVAFWTSRTSWCWLASLWNKNGLGLGSIKKTLVFSI